MTGARRDAVAPGNQIPGNGRQQRGNDQELGGIRGGHDPFANRGGDGGACQRSRNVENTGHQHRGARCQHPCCDRGRDGVGRIVEAIDKIEDEADGDDQNKYEES